MKQILFLIFFPLSLSAQFQKDLTLKPNPNVNPNVNSQLRTGKALEFISYPLFAGSGFCYGLSKKFREIDSPESNRPEIYSIATSVGFVTSAGVWGVGFSLQGKPSWKDLYKVVAAGTFSTIGFYLGTQAAPLFSTK